MAQVPLIVDRHPDRDNVADMPVIGEYRPNHERCGMNSIWTSLFVAGSLSLLTTQIAAQENEHAVLGQGNVSCASLLNDHKGDDARASSRTAWVLGYVTAFNQYGSKPQGDVSEGKGTEEIMAWVEKYCEQHPNDSLYSASAALVREFRQRLGR
jgi:hypothetical protein